MTRIERYRRLVARALAGGPPDGEPFDTCRAALAAGAAGDHARAALTVLLEGMLARADLPIDETQLLVPLLKELARGTVTPEELL